MALYELVTTTELYAAATTIEAQNVYTYRDLSAGEGAAGDADALLDAFIADIVPVIQDATAALSAIVRVRVRDIYDDLEFVDYVGSSAGDLIGEMLPPYVAVRLRSPQLAIGAKRWQKFYGGITEGQQAGGQLNSGADTLWQAVATALSDPIVDPGVGAKTFRLVMLRKERYLPVGNVAPNYAYRYYETLAEQLDHMFDITDIAAMNELTTTNSRKSGRGL